MNLLIRNVPADINYKLGELAKKNKQSKQQYILNNLTLLAVYPDIVEVSDNYAALVNTTIATIKENSAILQKILER